MKHSRRPAFCLLGFQQLFFALSLSWEVIVVFRQAFHNALLSGLLFVVSSLLCCFAPSFLAGSVELDYPFLTTPDATSLVQLSDMRGAYNDGDNRL